MLSAAGEPYLRSVTVRGSAISVGWGPRGPGGREGGVDALTASWWVPHRPADGAVAGVFDDGIG